ncbi:MAG TPA: hypothetical protein VMD30_00435 [Tepidisphaeraceae bacterium]|nr:hypothetical protein [Tepidisphaeraceae bacterium]
MHPKKAGTFLNPAIDVAETLRYVMGDTGDLQETMGGFRIKVHHTRAFPWDEVFKALVYRDFKVYVTRHKADLFIEATP